MRGPLQVEIDRLRAALTAAGWRKVTADQVVVPREATPEMCEQFYALRHREQSLAVSASDSYRAMISAAPPATPESGDR